MSLTQSETIVLPDLGINHPQVVQECQVQQRLRSRGWTFVESQQAVLLYVRKAQIDGTPLGTHVGFGGPKNSMVEMVSFGVP